MGNELVVFIGYDSREPRSYAVCEHSIHARSSNVVTRRLSHHALRREGLFSRPWRITAEGQHVDELDGLPFSTEFAHTRFLVPTLARQMNAGRYVVFCDGDFLWLDDARKLLEDLETGRAVHVAKHNYNVNSGVKMDGKIQSLYKYKLWSSLMVFDLAHPANLDLTPDVVNSKSGSWLHQFKWLPGDECIGALDPAWNFIPSFSEVSGASPPKAIHYTLGTPEMPGYERGPMSDFWYQELQDLQLNGATL